MLVNPGRWIHAIAGQLVSQARWPQWGWRRHSSHRWASRAAGSWCGQVLGRMGAVGQGVQPAGGVAAQPAMHGLVADPLALGDLGHHKPSRSTSMTALQRCSATVSSRSTLPTSSPRPRWAKHKTHGRSCQPSTRTLEPISRHQPVKHQPDQHIAQVKALARNLPETALRLSSLRPTAQSSAIRLWSARLYGHIRRHTAL